MKKKIIIAGITVVASWMATTSSLKAQDTIKVARKTQDTVKVVSDTVKVVKETEKVYVHDAPPQEPKSQKPPLRAGELGVRFMPTFTMLSFQNRNGEVIEGTASVNYGYGAMLGMNFSKNVGIQAEVNYLDINQKYTDRDLEREVKISYLNIPVLLSLNTDKTMPVNFNVVVGPQFGINVGSSTSTSSSSNTDTLHAVLALKQGDIGIAYGAGLEFALNKEHTFRFDLGFRGMYGVVNINSTNTDANTYNILVNASRKSYGGYAGFTFVW